MPASLKDVAEIESKNKNVFWQDTIAKETKVVGVTFGILEILQVSPIGHKINIGHIVFDAMIDFTRKSRWVLDANDNPSPDGHTHSVALSRDIARMSFTWVALRDADIWSCDIQNAYL